MHGGISVEKGLSCYSMSAIFNFGDFWRSMAISAMHRNLFAVTMPMHGVLTNYLFVSFMADPDPRSSALTRGRVLRLSWW